jgi:DNA-binding NarL/FixJ family response regulator
MEKVRILIADDHEVMREGTRLLIERQPGWEVCGVAGTGRQAVERAITLKPDIVVLDMGLPEIDGLEAARRIKQSLPKAELLMFTAHDTDDLIHEAFEAGVRSFVPKSGAAEHLVLAIKALSQHKPFFTERVSNVLFAKFRTKSTVQEASRKNRGSLTPREREIVRLLAEGKSNKEVADALGISIRTAETHRNRVMHKPGIGSLSGLVRYAIRKGIIDA